MNTEEVFDKAGRRVTEMRFKQAHSGRQAKRLTQEEQLNYWVFAQGRFAVISTTTTAGLERLIDKRLHQASCQPRNA